MGKISSATFWTVIVAALFGGFIATVVIHFYHQSWLLCQGPNCFRDWLGATSGWVAAFVAGLVAWRTLAKLSEQVDDAKRQTAAITGTEPPAVQIVSTSIRQIELRIVNWNRRPYRIRAVFTHMNPTFVTKIDGKSVDAQMGPGWVRLHRPIVISGYENRNDIPPATTIVIRVLSPTGGGKSVRPADFPISIYGDIMGEKVVEHKLCAQFSGAV